MREIALATRLWAFLLSAVLLVPDPALALRQTGLEEQEVLGHPVGAKDELLTALAPQTATGMEEGFEYMFLLNNKISMPIPINGNGQAMELEVELRLNDREASLSIASQKVPVRVIPEEWIKRLTSPTGDPSLSKQIADQKPAVTFPLKKAAAIYIFLPDTLTALLKTRGAEELWRNSASARIRLNSTRPSRNAATILVQTPSEISEDQLLLSRDLGFGTWSDRKSIQTAITVNAFITDRFQRFDLPESAISPEYIDILELFLKDLLRNPDEAGQLFDEFEHRKKLDPTLWKTLRDRGERLIGTVSAVYANIAAYQKTTAWIDKFAIFLAATATPYKEYAEALSYGFRIERLLYIRKALQAILDSENLQYALIQWDLKNRYPGKDGFVMLHGSETKFSKGSLALETMTFLTWEKGLADNHASGQLSIAKIPFDQIVMASWLLVGNQTSRVYVDDEIGIRGSVEVVAALSPENTLFDTIPTLPSSLKRSTHPPAALWTYQGDLLPAWAKDIASINSGAEESSGEEEITPIHRTVDLYAHSSVAGGALSLIPGQWRLGQVIPLDEDPEKANAGLEEAGRRAAQGQLVLVAVDSNFRGNLKLPAKAIVIIMNPATLDRVDTRAVAGYLERPWRLAGLLIDLSSGSILFMELPEPTSAESLRQAA